MTRCPQCNQDLPAVAKMATRLRKVNSDLHAIGLVYWDTLGESIVAIEHALGTSGFSAEVGPISPTTPGEYRLHIEVGDSKWLSASWYRMESGRYEVVAYVN